jgi:hypothetical protein|tara:strand:+ start:3444 stop:3611 length:168 start_codon:yes stop_codon:yes gene_type:complete
MTEGQALRDPTHIGLIYQSGCAQATTALGVLAGKQVTLPLPIALYLAIGGYFKPL